MLTRLWLFLYEYSVYVISFGLVKVLTLMISSREEYRERERKKDSNWPCPFLLSILLILFVVETPAMLWHTLSRSCDHVHTISTAFQISIIQLAFFYYSLLFVRLVEIVVNIIDLLISCTSYNWIIGQFAINYLFFYRLYSRLIYTRWKKKKIGCCCKTRIFQFQSLY